MNDRTSTPEPATRSPLVEPPSDAFDPCPDPIRLTIAVHRQTLTYFAGLLQVTDPSPALLARATEDRDAVNSSWNAVRDTATEVLSGFGLRPWADGCTVRVTPRTFRLGASNPGRGLIVYGQPQRFPSFDGVVIAHELAHIALSRALAPASLPITLPIDLEPCLRAAVDEALALLVEDSILRVVTGNGYESVWSQEELDHFHSYAWAVVRRSGLAGTAPDGCLPVTLDRLAGAARAIGAPPDRPHSISALLRDREEREGR
jgi:hypothetical protein